MDIAQLYRGGMPQPTYLASPELPWCELGSITVQQAYPDVDARDYPTVVALTATKRVLWSLPNPSSGFMLRFQTTTNADSHVVSLLGFASPTMLSAPTAGTRLSDHAVLLGALTLTGGQQVANHSNVFVDTIVAADGLWQFTVADSGNDRIAVAWGDSKTLKAVVVIATTLHAAKTLYVEGKTW